MGHPMPPRTTQKSCKAWPLRQKSQIEPWLAHRPQILLVGVSVWHRQFDADTMYPTTPSAALLLLKAKDHRRRKGLNDENYLSPASWEKCFLLTFPFIEPAPLQHSTLCYFFTRSPPVFRFSRFLDNPGRTRVANKF